MKALLAMLLCLLCGAAQAEDFVSKVIAVLDGDTVLILHGGVMLKVRLADIDAPEVAHAGSSGQPAKSPEEQPFGAASQRSLAGMVQGKQVRFVSQAIDGYGRMVARLSVDGLDVNREQIRRGMAWEYSHYHSNHELIALQAEARRAPRGLWAQSAPVPPWEWRKQHASAQQKQPQKNEVTDPSCGNKRHCAQMSSCEEARHYLHVCGLKYLDGDGDGTPCEYLCNPRAAGQK